LLDVSVVFDTYKDDDSVCQVCGYDQYHVNDVNQKHICGNGWTEEDEYEILGESRECMNCGYTWDHGDI